MSRHLHTTGARALIAMAAIGVLALILWVMG
jgi:hypothetical protein